EVADALEVLRTLHRGRNRRSFADTIARLLAATRAHAAIAIWPTGEQALANVMRLMDMARRYEAARGATSLRGFVDELEARAQGAPLRRPEKALVRADDCRMPAARIARTW